MANQRFNQFYFSKTPMLSVLELNVPIGATGAVGTIVGQGITSVTRLAAGIYAIKLNDNYNKVVQFDGHIESPITGGNVTAGSFATGTLYQITALGNTNWATAGLNSNFTAAVGMCFVGAAAGSGTGTAKVVSNSGLQSVELMPSPDSMLQPTTGTGSLFIIQTLGATNSSTTTLIPTDPANGSSVRIRMSLCNSSAVPSY